MNIIRNIIKGPITSVLGLAIICLTSYACIFKDMNWIYEGLAGCGFGCLLVFAPDSIPGYINAIFKKKTE